MDFIPPDNPYAFVPWLAIIGAALAVFTFIRWSIAGKAQEKAGGKQDLDFAYPWMLKLSGAVTLAAVPLFLHTFWLQGEHKHRVAETLVEAAADAYGVEVDEAAALRLLTTQEPSRGGMRDVTLDLHPQAGETVSGFAAGALFPDGMYRTVQLVFDGDEWMLVQPETTEAEELSAP